MTHIRLNQERRWYRMDMIHANYGFAISVIDTKHKQGAPGTLLSVTENDDLTESLVKVEWENKAARDSVAFIGGLILQEYDRSDHHLAITLLQTDPNWSNTR